MAIIRRRRRVVRRRRPTKRLAIPRGPRIRRGAITGPHTFKRVVDWNAETTTNLTVGGNLSFPGGAMMQFAMPSVFPNLDYGNIGYQFSINDLPSLSEFTNLFDSFRIVKVVLRIRPYSNNAATTFSGAPNTAPATSGFIHYAIDNDDAAAPTASEAGITELQQKTSYKVKPLVSNKPIVITIKPRYAQSMFASTIATGYTQGRRSNWLDLGYPETPHYGFKAVLEGYSPNATDAHLGFRAETTYFLQFKGPR